MRELEMRPNKTQGLLFTFCSLDGCGKTMMLTRLKEELEREHTVFLTKQPFFFDVPVETAVKRVRSRESEKTDILIWNFSISFVKSTLQFVTPITVF